jgi:hypothetical protein
LLGDDGSGRAGGSLRSGFCSCWFVGSSTPQVWRTLSP